MPKLGLVARAFELAAQGQSSAQLKSTLRAEGYDLSEIGGHLAPGLLTRQLSALAAKVRRTEDEPSPIGFKMKVLSL